MAVQFHYELTAEGAAKRYAMNHLIQASRRLLQSWLSGSVRDLSKAAGRLQKSGKGKHSSSMSRNIGMAISAPGEPLEGHVGTGVGGTMTIKYASIQDQGGVITAKGKYLTIPFKGVDGTARDYKSFIFKSKAGNLIMAEKILSGKGSRGQYARSGIRPLFLLKKQVTIPATYWFSSTIDIRRQLLDAMLQPESVYEEAMKMGGA